MEGVVVMNNQNEIIYELSIRKAQKLFELNLINKADFKKFKAFLIEKYKPINPSLLGLWLDISAGKSDE